MYPFFGGKSTSFKIDILQIDIPTWMDCEGKTEPVRISIQRFFNSEGLIQNWIL